MGRNIEPVDSEIKYSLGSVSLASQVVLVIRTDGTTHDNAGTFYCMKLSLDQELTFFRHRYNHVHPKVFTLPPVLWFVTFEFLSGFEAYWSVALSAGTNTWPNLKKRKPSTFISASTLIFDITLSQGGREHKSVSCCIPTSDCCPNLLWIKDSLSLNWSVFKQRKN